MTKPFATDRLLDLWSTPLPDGEAAEEAFRDLYTDPVTVNGASLTAADLSTGPGPYRECSPGYSAKSSTSPTPATRSQSPFAYPAGT